MSDMSFDPPVPSPEPPPPPPPSPPPEPPIPWEDPGVSLWSGLLETVGLFLTDPTQAFRRTPTAAGLGRPLAYFLALGVLGAVAGGLYGIFFQSVMKAVMPGLGGSQSSLPPPAGAILEWVQSVGGQVTLIAISPILLLIRLFVAGGIVHLALLVFRGAHRGFAATLRAYCYAGTVDLVLLVPICGGIAAFIWFLVLFILGLGILHGCGAGKAALAVLVPLLVCCACYAAGFAAMMGAGMLSSMVGGR